MRLALLITAAALAIAGPAFADPCKAISDSGRFPPGLTPTSTFAGTVRYVGDGDSLCVGTSADNAGWIEVRLADFRAPELREAGGQAAKAALTRIALGRRVTCQGRNRTYDRIAAVCRLDGVPLGRLMRRAGVAEGGN